eukprot:m.122143 g.122143  ORF g.122143 m.122143 type:complete len:452 (-) comp14420_c0_seq1:1430-2785(-)
MFSTSYWRLTCHYKHKNMQAPKSKDHSTHIGLLTVAREEKSPLVCVLRRICLWESAHVKSVIGGRKWRTPKVQPETKAEKSEIDDDRQMMADLGLPMSFGKAKKEKVKKVSSKNDSNGQRSHDDPGWQTFWASWHNHIAWEFYNGSSECEDKEPKVWEEYLAQQYHDYYEFYWSALENSNITSITLERTEDLRAQCEPLGFSVPLEREKRLESPIRFDKSNDTSFENEFIRESIENVTIENLHLDKEADMKKYYAQRYRFFSKFDDGIQLDRESWYSVTPEKIALHIAQRCSCDVIIDAFCGAGGNSIQFAQHCKRVIAIDIDPEKIRMAKHNAEIYHVAEQIDFVQGNFLEIGHNFKADVVFLSPPWGGPQYLNRSHYDLDMVVPSINEIRSTAARITKNLVYFLPRNTDVMQLMQLAEEDGVMELEQQVLNRKLKTVCVYVGPTFNSSQ